MIGLVSGRFVCRYAYGLFTTPICLPPTTYFLMSVQTTQPTLTPLKRMADEALADDPAHTEWDNRRIRPCTESNAPSSSRLQPALLSIDNFQARFMQLEKQVEQQTARSNGGHKATFSYKHLKSVIDIGVGDLNHLDVYNALTTLISMFPEDDEGYYLKR